MLTAPTIRRESVKIYLTSIRQRTTPHENPPSTACSNRGTDHLNPTRTQNPRPLYHVYHQIIKKIFRGATGIRTPDPLLAKQVL
jgi:hypothetical protein